LRGDKGIFAAFPLKKAEDEDEEVAEDEEDEEEELLVIAFISDMTDFISFSFDLSWVDDCVCSFEWWTLDLVKED